MTYLDNEFESDCINLLDDTKTYIDSLITRKIEDQQKKTKGFKIEDYYNGDNNDNNNDKTMTL